MGKRKSIGYSIKSLENTKKQKQKKNIVVSSIVKYENLVHTRAFVQEEKKNLNKKQK